MGWTTGLESTQKLGEKGIDLTRVKGQTAVRKEVVDNMFFFFMLEELKSIGWVEFDLENNHTKNDTKME